MTTLSILEVVINNKDYCQIIINKFKQYANNNCKSKSFQKFIKIDFEDYTKKY